MSNLLCIGLMAAQATAAQIPADSFTLAWTHSIAKTRWEEDYAILAGRLLPIQARIQAGGPGMEPPPDARLIKGWFVYTPKLQPQTKISLSRQHADSHEICVGGQCRPLAQVAPAADPARTEIFVCGE